MYIVSSWERKKKGQSVQRKVDLLVVACQREVNPLLKAGPDGRLVYIAQRKVGLLVIAMSVPGVS